MRIIKLIIILNFLFCLSSCKTIREGFTNEKKNSTDEFLVEKKSPLVMPPEFNKLPLPNQNKDEDQEEKNTIKNLIVDNNGDVEKITSDTDLERSILSKIKSK